MVKFPQSFLIAAVVLSIVLSGCVAKQPALATSPSDLEGMEVSATGEHTSLVQSIPVGNTKGFTAPDFTIETINGTIVSLQQLTSDKPTLLYFWATWCPYCKNDLAEAEKVYPEYKDKVHFLAIDLDSKETASQIAAYQEQHGHSLLQFAAADVRVLRDYGITSTTTKIAIDRNRLILWRGSGEVDEKTWRIILDGLASS